MAEQTNEDNRDGKGDHRQKDPQDASVKMQLGSVVDDEQNACGTDDRTDRHARGQGLLQKYCCQHCRDDWSQSQYKRRSGRISRDKTFVKGPLVDEDTDDPECAEQQPIRP